MKLFSRWSEKGRSKTKKTRPSETSGEQKKKTPSPQGKASLGQSGQQGREKYRRVYYVFRQKPPMSHVRAFADIKNRASQVQCVPIHGGRGDILERIDVHPIHVTKPRQCNVFIPGLWSTLLPVAVPDMGPSEHPRPKEEQKAKGRRLPRSRLCAKTRLRRGEEGPGLKAR